MATRRGLSDHDTAPMGKTSFDTSIPPLSSKASLDSERGAPPRYEHPSPVMESSRPAPQAEFIDPQESEALPPRPVKTTPASKSARGVRISLWTFLALLMCSSAVEIGFAGAVADWLITLTYSRRSYPIDIGSGQSKYVSAVPRDLVTEGSALALTAGAVALVLVGFGGIGALDLRSRANYSKRMFSKVWYHSWLIIVVLSWVFTLATMVYIFVVNASVSNSAINVGYMSAEGSPYGQYPNYNWDPKQWFSQVLAQPLTSQTDRANIALYYDFIDGYYYNIIVMFLLGLTVLGLAVWDGILARRAARQL